MKTNFRVVLVTAAAYNWAQSLMTAGVKTRSRDARVFAMFGMSVKLNGSVIHYLKYRKVPIISPGLIFVQKAVLLAYFRGSLFSEGLIIGRTFAFQNGFGLTIKTASVKHYELKQPKTA